MCTSIIEIARAEGMAKRGDECTNLAPLWRSGFRVPLGY